MYRTGGKREFHSYKDENPSKFFFFHDPLVDFEKKRRRKAMPNFFILMCICGIFSTVKCIVGHSLGALMYLKTKTQQRHHLSSFLQLLQKFQMSRWCFWIMYPFNRSINQSINKTSVAPISSAGPSSEAHKSLAWSCVIIEAKAGSPTGSGAAEGLWWKSQVK